MNWLVEVFNNKVSRTRCSGKNESD